MVRTVQDDCTYIRRADAKTGKALTIAKVNVDDNPEKAGQYGVMSIPTLKVFKNGVDVEYFSWTPPTC